MTPPQDPTPFGCDSFDHLLGLDPAPSDWIETSQADVDAHAATAGDGGWIHNDVERSAAGPYGSTLLQGTLMQANLPRMIRGALDWPTEGILNRFHYGYDRVRFVNQVPTGSRIRGQFALTGVVPKADDGRDVLARLGCTIEAELADGTIRTAVVADMLAYFVADRAADQADDGSADGA